MTNERLVPFGAGLNVGTQRVSATMVKENLKVTTGDAEMREEPETESKVRFGDEVKEPVEEVLQEEILQFENMRLSQE